MPLLQRLQLATTTTTYQPIPVRSGCVGAFISWPDAVSSATITLEFTSSDAAVTDASANQWKDSGLAFTGPAASAAGALLVNVENVRQKRARFKIVTAAATTLEIWDGTDG